MKNLRLLALIILMGMVCVGASAQIGYQVALLNSATGEARANERVTVNISLSNSANEVFYEETKQATTNDFGVLSLTIGNENTFSQVDFSKLPFFISVTVNDVLVGRTQVLTVPIAEASKKLVPVAKEKIVGRQWVIRENSNMIIIFYEDGTGHYLQSEDTCYNFEYEIDGNTIYCYFDGTYQSNLILRYYKNKIHKISKE